MFHKNFNDFVWNLVRGCYICGNDTDMTKENWIKWLQQRIPELKKSHNEFWLSQALDGYLEDTLKIKKVDL